MPPLKRNGHELFAQRVAEGNSLTKAYILAGYSEKAAPVSASLLNKRADVAARIDEIRAAISKGREKLAILDQERRAAKQNARWEALHQVIEERAQHADFAAAPGGKTGLLARKLKQIGSGDTAQLVEEFEVDTGLLNEARRLEELVSKEYGQHAAEKSNGTDVRVQVAIAFPQMAPDVQAQMMTPQTVDLPAAQKRLLSRQSDGKPL